MTQVVKWLLITVLVWTMGAASLARGETRVVPFLSVSERYDSNVFFAKKSTLAALNLEGDDWVTNVTPQLLTLHKGAYATGTFQAGASGEAYAKNNELNYVGYNGVLSVNLTDGVRRLDPRAKLWISAGSYYNPTPPAFVNPSLESAAVNPLVRGIQSSRVNTLSYTVGSGGTYDLSSSTYVQASYYYSSIVFLKAPEELQGGGTRVFDTVSQGASGGIGKKLSPQDSLSLNYLYQRTTQATANAFKTHSLSGAWSRAHSRDLFILASGGVTMFETLRDPSTGEVLAPFGKVFPSGTVSVTYQTRTQRLFGESGGAPAPAPMFNNITGVPGGSIGVPGATFLSLYYSVGVYPSYAIAAGPSVSHVIGAGGAYGLTERMSVVAGGSYAYNKAADARQSFSFSSYSVNAGVSFLISQNFKGSFVGSYSDFRQESIGANDSFNRWSTTLSITYVYGSGFGAPTAFFAGTPVGNGSQPGSSGVENK